MRLQHNPSTGYLVASIDHVSLRPAVVPLIPLIPLIPDICDRCGSDQQRCQAREAWRAERSRHDGRFARQGHGPFLLLCCFRVVYQHESPVSLGAASRLSYRKLGHVPGGNHRLEHN